MPGLERDFLRQLQGLMSDDRDAAGLPSVDQRYIVEGQCHGGLKPRS